MSEIVVTGAAGHVGSAVADALMSAGHPFRVAGPDMERLKSRFPVADSVVRLDFFDPDTSGPTVRGRRSVFLLRPPPISKVNFTINPFIDVALDNGVDHIVFSSVAVAESNSIVPQHRIEKHIFESGVDYTILRRGFFSQNLESAYRRDIVEDDRIFVPADYGVVTFIDTRDLGEVAALALTAPGHRNQAYHLTGSEAIDFDRVSELLTDALGRTVRYEPAHVIPHFFHLTSQGLAAPHALVQTILHTGLRRGDGAPVTRELERLLGRPPRTMADYVADRAECFEKTNRRECGPSPAGRHT